MSDQKQRVVKILKPLPNIHRFHSSLYKVWDDFQNLILDKIGPILPVFTGDVVYKELPEHMTSTKMLENGHFVSKMLKVSNALSIIEELVSRQKEGTSGDLYTDGDSNLFPAYFDDNSKVIICITWDADSRKWNLHAFSPNHEFEWCMFSRVFSEAA